MSRRCRSRPFMPGSFMSRMAHAVPIQVAAFQEVFGRAKRLDSKAR